MQLILLKIKTRNLFKRFESILMRLFLDYKKFSTLSVQENKTK